MLVVVAMRMFDLLIEYCMSSGKAILVDEAIAEDYCKQHLATVLTIQRKRDWRVSWGCL